VRWKGNTIGDLHLICVGLIKRKEKFYNRGGKDSVAIPNAELVSIIQALNGEMSPMLKSNGE